MAAPGVQPVQQSYWNAFTENVKAGAKGFIYIVCNNKNNTTQLGRMSSIAASVFESKRGDVVAGQIDAACFIDDIEYFTIGDSKEDWNNRREYFLARAAFTVADFGTTYLWLKDMGFQVANSVTNAIGNSNITAGVTLVGFVTGFARIGFTLAALDAAKRVYNEGGWKTQKGIHAMLDLAYNTAAVARPVLGFFVLSGSVLTGFGVIAIGFGLMSFTYGLYMQKEPQAKKNLSLAGDVIDSAAKIAGQTDAFEKGLKLVKGTLGLVSISGNSTPALDQVSKDIGVTTQTAEVLGIFDRANEFFVDDTFLQKSSKWKILNRGLIAVASAVEGLNMFNLLAFASAIKYFNVPVVTLTKNILVVGASVFGAIDSKLTLDKPSAELAKVNGKIGAWQAAGVSLNQLTLDKLNLWRGKLAEIKAEDQSEAAANKREKAGRKIAEWETIQNAANPNYEELKTRKLDEWRRRKVIAERNADIASNSSQLTGLNELTRVATVSAATFSQSVYNNSFNVTVAVLAFINAGLGISKFLYSAKNEKQPLTAAAA